MSVTVSDTPAPIGHNSGAGLANLAAALDPAVLAADLVADTEELMKRLGVLSAAYERFLVVTKDGIADEETSGKAGDFVRQLSDAITTADRRRQTIKKPVLDAQRAIDAHFKTKLGDPLEAMKTAVLKRVTAFLTAQRQAAEKARREEEERRRAAAAALAAQAEAEGNQGLMDAAVELESMADNTAAQPVERVAVRSDLGTTVSTRKGPWQVRIVDATKVPAGYLIPNEPMLLAFAKSSPEEAVLKQPVPGVEFWRETKASIR